VRRALSWVIAIAALAFVAVAVPVRDRCWDPRAPASTRLAVSREEGGACTLHLRSGDVRVDAAECSQLRCEPGVASTFAHARPGILGLLLLLYAIGTVPWAARWRALLGLAGVHLTLGEAWRVSIEAQAGGVLLPGGIGGDALRIVSVVGRPMRAEPSAEGTGEGGGEAARSPTAIAVASVALDRAVGLAVLSALAAGLGFAWGGLRAGPLAFALAAIPLAFVAGLVALRLAPLHRARSLLESRVGNAVRPVLEYVRDPRAPRAIAVAAALSVLVAAVQLATIRGLVLALGGAPTAEKWVYVGSAMAFLAGAVPALPGGWGTADAAYVFFLGLAGLPASTALAVCLLYRLFWYLSGIAGALLHVARLRVPAVATRAGSEPPS
jgi:uncharacterized membrane protein YbhN (UPF0104 family)